MDWTPVLTTIISSVLGGAVAISVARLSNTKGERLTDLLESVSKAADMTAEQLVQKLTEIESLRKRIEQLENKNVVLWQYLIILLEQLRTHDITPADPPDTLKNDPELVRYLRWKRRDE